MAHEVVEVKRNAANRPPRSWARGTLGGSNRRVRFHVLKSVERLSCHPQRLKAHPLISGILVSWPCRGGATASGEGLRAASEAIHDRHAKASFVTRLGIEAIESLRVQPPQRRK